MNEEKLREAIRSEIKKILNERSYLDRAKRTASTRLSALSKMQGFDRLKEYLNLLIILLQTQFVPTIQYCKGLQSLLSRYVYR